MRRTSLLSRLLSIMGCRAATNSKNTRHDAEFGDMIYMVDAWDGDISFESGPIKTAHFHIRSDESGPSGSQRDLVLELRERHRRLWPEICQELLKCHAEIETPEELTRRLTPVIGINLYDDTNSIELVYTIDGDPFGLAYFIVLQDWKITEAHAAE